MKASKGALGAVFACALVAGCASNPAPTPGKTGPSAGGAHGPAGSVHGQPGGTVKFTGSGSLEVSGVTGPTPQPVGKGGRPAVYDNVPTTRGGYTFSIPGLEYFRGNIKTNAFAMKVTYDVTDPLGLWETDQYWIMFDWENAQGGAGTQYFDTNNLDANADYRVDDGSAYISTQFVPGGTSRPKPWPIVITQHIRVGCEGTQYIVRNNVNADHSVQEVYLVDGDNLTIEVPNTNISAQLHRSDIGKNYMQFSIVGGAPKLTPTAYTAADANGNGGDAWGTYEYGIKKKAGSLCVDPPKP